MNQHEFFKANLIQIVLYTCETLFEFIKTYILACILNLPSVRVMIMFRVAKSTEVFFKYVADILDASY